MEVGTWNSLSNFYDRYPTHSPLELKQEYLKFCDKELKVMMGKVYQEVTKACLQADNSFSQVNGGTELNFQEVIQKLQSCMI